MEDPPEFEEVILKLRNNLPVCRVCLNITMECIELDSILCLANGHEITYFDGFNVVAPSCIELPDKFLTMLCASCGSDLLSAFLFRKRVENADIILSKIKNYLVESANDSNSMIGPTSEILYADNLLDQNSHMQKSFLQIDKLIKDEDNTLPTSSELREPSKINENWPPSPTNSLYTDSDSSEASEESQMFDGKVNKFSEPSIWMCNDCEEICMSRRMLRRHRRHHQITNDGESRCKKCNKSVKSIEELENHMCFHKFSETLPSESGKFVYRCLLCERKYRCETDFIDHMNIHKDKKPHSCINCSEVFHTKHLLRVHMLRLHRSSQKVPKRESKRTNIEKKEKCSHCNKMVRKSFMEIHKESHFGPRNSMCTECGKQFASRLALRTHSLIHIQSGEFHCHICDKMCQTVYALKSHIQFKHLMDKSLIGKKQLKYQCEDCGLIFQYPSKLKVHRRKHNSEAPYKCPHCHRGYVRKDQFNIHLRYHNNDLPYKCDRCDKSYATKNNLTEHIKSAHDKVVYDCDNCDQKFKSVTGLRKHKFLHTGYPYVCPICGLGQPFRSGIKAHLLRVHKDSFTEDEFNEKFPVVIPKSGFRRPKT